MTASKLRTQCTPEEAAAVVAALASLRSRTAEPTGYELWRRRRVEAVHRTS